MLVLSVIPQINPDLYWVVIRLVAKYDSDSRFPGSPSPVDVFLAPACFALRWIRGFVVGGSQLASSPSARVLGILTQISPVLHGGFRAQPDRVADAAAGGVGAASHGHRVRCRREGQPSFTAIAFCPAPLHGFSRELLRAYLSCEPFTIAHQMFALRSACRRASRRSVRCLGFSRPMF